MKWVNACKTLLHKLFVNTLGYYYFCCDCFNDFPCFVVYQHVQVNTFLPLIVCISWKGAILKLFTCCRTVRLSVPPLDLQIFEGIPVLIKFLYPLFIEFPSQFTTEHQVSSLCYTVNSSMIPILNMVYLFICLFLLNFLLTHNLYFIIL